MKASIQAKQKRRILLSISLTNISKKQLEEMEKELSEVLTFTKAGWPVIDPDGVNNFVLEHAKELFGALRMAQNVAPDFTSNAEVNEGHE